MTSKRNIKEVKNTYFLRLIEPTISELSEKHKIPKEDVEEMIMHFFETLKSYLEDWRMPKVIVPNFGTFKPSYKSITNWIRRSFLFYHRGSMSKEKLVEVIERLWPVKERLSDEKNGIHSWKKYSKLTKDEYNKAKSIRRNSYHSGEQESVQKNDD